MKMSRLCFKLFSVVSLVAVCLVCVSSPSLAQNCGTPTALKDALKAVSQAADILSQAPAGYGNAPDKLGKPLEAARLAALASEKMCGCSGAADVAACLQASLDKQFVCDLYELSGLPDFTNPFSVMAIYFPPVGIPLSVAYELRYGEGANPFCSSGTGQSNLMCCKYNPSQASCHTGFAGPHAVNCLGAVEPNNPQQFGPVEMTPFGPSCNHIAECVSSGQASTTPNSKTQRQTQWMQDLSSAYANAVYGSGPSSCTADFAMLIGCRGWLQVARQGEPYFGLLSATSLPTGPAAVRFRKELMPVAAQRVMYAIPNGLERFEHISSRVWTAADKTTYLGNIRAEEELKSWLSGCGLELLKTTMPSTWELMAVPAPQEPAINRPAQQDWVDGCLVGDPPRRLGLTAQRQAQEVSIHVEAIDPEADPANPDVNPVSIDWGDGTVTGEIYRHGQPNVFSHSYTARVASSARVVYLNSAGLSIAAEAAIP